jgi:hypothetical protein
MKKKQIKKIHEKHLKTVLHNVNNSYSFAEGKTQSNKRVSSEGSRIIVSVCPLKIRSKVFKSHTGRSAKTEIGTTSEARYLTARMRIGNKAGAS